MSRLANCIDNAVDPTSLKDIEADSLIEVDALTDVERLVDPEAELDSEDWVGYFLRPHYLLHQGFLFVSETVGASDVASSALAVVAIGTTKKQSYRNQTAKKLGYAFDFLFDLAARWQ